METANSTINSNNISLNNVNVNYHNTHFQYCPSRCNFNHYKTGNSENTTNMRQIVTLFHTFILLFFSHTSMKHCYNVTHISGISTIYWLYATNW